MPAVPAKPALEIEYCTQCRWLLRAAWMAQELLTTFEVELGSVALVPPATACAASTPARTITSSSRSICLSCLPGSAR